MDNQEIINSLAGAIGFLFAWILQGYRTRFKNIEDKREEDHKRAQELELLVSGKYLTRLDHAESNRKHEESNMRMQEKLDKVIDKLDNVPCKLIDQRKNPR